MLMAMTMTSTMTAVTTTIIISTMLLMSALLLIMMVAMAAVALRMQCNKSGGRVRLLVVIVASYVSSTMTIVIRVTVIFL